MSSSTSPKPKNWLLAKSRRWHTWGGLIAGLFLLLVGVSGIVLNYKKPIFTALGLEPNPVKTARSTDHAGTQKVSTSTLPLTTASALHDLPVTIERACELARAQWGDVPLERIELKSERGELIYKIKQPTGREIWVNAATGASFTKGAYERFAKPGTDGVPTQQTDWGKILLDLHTGKIAGTAGKAVISIAALLLVFLSISGAYMWAKPLLIRRSNARAKAPECLTSPRPNPEPTACLNIGRS
jgi:uncharacterized iron-regulated membrane protein